MWSILEKEFCKHAKYQDRTRKSCVAIAQGKLPPTALDLLLFHLSVPGNDNPLLLFSMFKPMTYTTFVPRL